MARYNATTVAANVKNTMMELSVRDAFDLSLLVMAAASATFDIYV